MLAAAALLALPGCGSDDEPSATTAPEDGGGVVVAALGDSISASAPSAQASSRAASSSVRWPKTPQLRKLSRGSARSAQNSYLSLIHI